MNPRYRVVEARYPADFERLRAVREPVFVVEQHCPIDEEWDALDAPSRHVLVLDEHDQPVATGRLTPERKIGRMAVLAAHRQHGLGALVMEHLIAMARQIGYDQLALSAQVHAIPFYERFGFIAEGPEYLDANIPHRTMTRPLPLAAPSCVIALDRLAAVRATACDLLRNAHHRVAVAGPTLDAAVFDHEAATALLKRVALSGRGARIQVLVSDIGPAVQDGHRWIGLAQRLSSMIEIRRIHRSDDPEFGPAVLLNDVGGWMRRPDPSRFDGEAAFDDRPRSRELWLTFERSWERAVPETAIRALKL